MTRSKRTALTGIAMLSGGSLAGNAIAFGGSIWLARLFTPAQHGEFAILAALAVSVTPLVSGRFEAALAIPRQAAHSLKLLKLGLLWSFAMTVALTALALVLPSAVNILSSEAWTPPAMLWVAPILAYLGAQLALVNQFNVRQGVFRAVAIRNVVYPAAAAGGQVFLGLLRFGASGLALGAIAGRLITLGLLLPGILRHRGTFAESRTSVTYQDLLRRFGRFPTVLAASAIINALGLQLPVLLLGYWYGTDAAGHFGMYQRTVGVPLVLIGAAVGQVYLSRMSRAMREGSGAAVSIFRSSSRALLVLGLISAAGLFVLGPSLFALVFGESWRTSGEIARAMAPAFAAQLLASPLSQALIVYEKYAVQWAWDVGRLALVFVALAGGRLMGFDLIGACWLASGASLIAYSASWLLSRHAVRAG